MELYLTVVIVGANFVYIVLEYLGASIVHVYEYFSGCSNL